MIKNDNDNDDNCNDKQYCYTSKQYRSINIEQ